MQTRSVAVVLLALLCGQAVSAGPLGPLAAALVGGAKVVENSVKAGIATADAAKDQVASTMQHQFDHGLNTVAKVAGIDWNKDLVTVKNFTVGKCTGNGYCFPRYVAAQTAKPTSVCAKNFTSLISLPMAGNLMCVKKTPSSYQQCFKSLKCSIDTKQTAKNCVDPKVQQMMAELFVAFKVKAILPFTVLPTLASAIKAAAIVKPIIAADALKDLVAGGFAALANKDAADQAALTIKALVADGLKVNITMVQSNPVEDFAKGLLAMNHEQMMPMLPQIKTFTQSALATVANVTGEVKKVIKSLPLCMYTCCKTIKMETIELSTPNMVCSKGMTYDKFANVCYGKSASYKACPKGMLRCATGFGKRPMCVAAPQLWGLNSCHVLEAMDTMGKLTKVACP